MLGLGLNKESDAGERLKTDDRFKKMSFELRSLFVTASHSLETDTRISDIVYPELKQREAELARWISSGIEENVYPLQHLLFLPFSSVDNENDDSTSPSALFLALRRGIKNPAFQERVLQLIGVQVPFLSH